MMYEKDPFDGSRRTDFTPEELQKLLDRIVMLENEVERLKSRSRELDVRNREFQDLKTKLLNHLDYDHGDLGDDS